MRTPFSLLDLKLGFRMMIKHPGLTGVAVLALTVAIGISAAWFSFIGGMLDPTLPLDDGERIVRIQNWDVAAAEPENWTLSDFATWRDDLRSVEELGAASSVEYTLSAEDGRSASVSGAQMTAAGFRVARVAPLLGRPLLPGDEGEGALPVVVLGYDLWQRLFDGDRRVIGEPVRVGNQKVTVVGVMPQGFGFPRNQEVWTPLRVDALQYGPRQGPGIVVIGRLARGTTLEEAQAELAAVGARTAAAFPETHLQLRPRIQRYLDSPAGGGMLTLSAFNIPFLLLLVVICINVATLVFARTAARQAELVMRSALGASRARLVLQLFAEALVLTSVAAVVGLALAHWAMGWGMELFWQIQESRPPFWFDPGLSLSTIPYTAALAIGAPRWSEPCPPCG